MLLGHVDTVVSHGRTQPLRRDGDRLYGPGTVDMKGGVVLALGVARELAQRPERFAELAVLLVTDEEWRTAPFAHVGRLRRLRRVPVLRGRRALGRRRRRASSSGARPPARCESAPPAAPRTPGQRPHRGANALLALARRGDRGVAAMHDPDGPERLSVVPTVMHSGEAINVVPAAGRAGVRSASRDQRAFEAVLAAVPQQRRRRRARGRAWSGCGRRWTPSARPRGCWRAPRELLGRPIVGRSRGGASDASHFAASIPLTVDGLGPRGGGAHTPEEFVFEPSLRERAEVALALALALLTAEPLSAAGRRSGSAMLCRWQCSRL